MGAVNPPDKNLKVKYGSASKTKRRISMKEDRNEEFSMNALQFQNKILREIQKTRKNEEKEENSNKKRNLEAYRQGQEEALEIFNNIFDME